MTTDLLDSIESPLFVNALGSNPTPDDIVRELARLQSQQSDVRKEIESIRSEKELIGSRVAQLAMKSIQDADLAYQLDILVQEYYRLIEQDKELSVEILRLKKIKQQDEKQINQTNEMNSDPVPTVSQKLSATGSETNLNIDKAGLTLMGKTYTWGQVAAFAISVLAVSFALAFPIKQPKPEEAKFN